MTMTTDSFVADSSTLDEPLLNCQNLSADGSIVAALRSGHGATSVCACSKFVAVGTRHGNVFIFQQTGACIRAFMQHQFGEIMALAIDDAMESIAATSSDGSVMIVDVFKMDSNPWMLYYPQRMLAVAFRPTHALLIRSVALGGVSGELILNSSNWFSNQDTVLHRGEGQITAIAWNGSLIAWANDVGVKVFDLATMERIAFISQERRLREFGASLSWFSANMLVAAQDDVVHVLQVVDSVGTLLARFQTSYQIRACVPFDNTTLAVLPGGKELHLLTIHGELRSQIKLNEAAVAIDRALTFVPGIDICILLLYQYDVVVARPRNDDDHITFLLDNSRIEEAAELALNPATNLRKHNVDDIAIMHLTNLLEAGRYDDVTEATPRMLGNNMALWEKWILYIYSAKLLAQTIASVIPCTEPNLLSPVVYNMVLIQVAESDADVLLLLLRKWDSSIYNPEAILKACLSASDEMKSKETFQVSIAVLYEKTSQLLESLNILLRVKNELVFDLLRRHRELLNQADLNQLLELSAAKAVGLLVTAKLSPQAIVEKVHDSPQHLHVYLHALFEFDREAGRALHNKQVPLYAQFQPDKLLLFLQQSNHYNLDEALHVCSEFKLYECQLYLLRRMGNNSGALDLMVEEGDVIGGIRFVEHKRSRRLRAQLFTLLLASNDRIGIALTHLRRDFIDPAKFIAEIPDGAVIPQLKEKLCSLISDYRNELSIQQMSKEISRCDCIHLLSQVQRFQATAIIIDPLQPTRCSECDRAMFKSSSDIVASAGLIQHADCNSILSGRIQQFR